MKLTFIEKNDAVVLLKDPQHLDKDAELLRKLAPTSKLHNEFAKANEFNRSSLSGRILLELLDYATVKEIQENRQSDKKPKETDAIGAEGIDANAAIVTEDPNATAGDDTNAAEGTEDLNATAGDDTNAAEGIGDPNATAGDDTNAAEGTGDPNATAGNDTTAAEGKENESSEKKKKAKARGVPKH